MKYTADTSGTTATFTPVEGPLPTQNLFFGPQAPLLAGVTVQDAFITFASGNYKYNLVTVSFLLTSTNTDRNVSVVEFQWLHGYLQ